VVDHRFGIASSFYASMVTFRNDGGLWQKAGRRNTLKAGKREASLLSY
jgi:hypothetical protein